jgi:hypothetical protein
VSEQKRGPVETRLTVGSDPDKGTEYRDRPMSFHWLCPLALIDALGLLPARSPAYGAARRMILAEAGGIGRRLYLFIRLRPQPFPNF